MMLAIIALLLLVIAGMLVHVIIRLLNKNDQLMARISNPAPKDEETESMLDALIIALNDSSMRENVKAVMNEAYKENF